MKFRKYLLVVLGLLLLVLSSTSTGAIAQNPITLTVALEAYQEEALGMNFFDQFESQYNVQVRVVSAGQSALLPSVLQNNSAEAHLNAFADYVRVADVLPIVSYQLSVEATRAGYVLDLMPLVSADSSLNPADFYRVAWEAYQWDDGMWVLPASMTLSAMVYDTSAFDSIGSAYPDMNWSLTDIGNVARALTTFDGNNTVTAPGFEALSIAHLFRSLLGQGIYVMNTFPNQPDFTDPILANLLNEWVALESEGVVARGGFDPNSVPFVLGGIGLADNNDSIFSPLANNTLGASVDGFAVSAGTQYPELAYLLAKYMTNGNQIFFGDLPARQNQAVDIDPIIANALPNAFGFSELRFFDYVELAIDRMLFEGVDAVSALQFAQSIVESNLQLAESRFGTTNIVVNNAPQLQGGEVELNFAVFTAVMPLPNETVWRDLADDFAEIDPDVGYVSTAGVNDFPANIAQTHDCFFMNGATSSLTSADVLVLDPLISTDTTVNQDDYLTGVLAQLRRDNQLLGLPIGVQPIVMWYDTTRFSQLGLDLTDGMWSVNEFNQALQSLQAPIFYSTNASNRDLLMLIASHGGLPVDFRTDPVSVNYTDPTTVDAIRQVLDYARSNLIHYNALVNIGMSSGTRPDLNLIPLHSDQLGSMSIRGAMRNGGMFGTDEPATDAYELVNFPQGAYTPISYTIPSAYIGANTPYADACYRWMQFLADHPDRFNLMPATYTQLNDPTFMATQSPDFMTFFSTFASLLQDPNAVVVPNTFSWGVGSDVPMTWLNRAFDAYVLNSADLETELVQAEQFTLDYQACIANIPPFDPLIQDQQSYREAFNQCATQVDPTMQ